MLHRSGYRCVFLCSASLITLLNSCAIERLEHLNTEIAFTQSNYPYIRKCFCPTCAHSPGHHLGVHVQPVKHLYEVLSVLGSLTVTRENSRPLLCVLPAQVEADVSLALTYPNSPFSRLWPGLQARMVSCSAWT